VSGEKLRDCAICGESILAKAYQANSVRTCSPVCASTLARREHPELERRSERLYREPSNGEAL